MTQHNKPRLILRITTTLVLFVLMLLFIKFRLDLQPNRITVRADLPQGFSSPQIQLNNGNAYAGATVSSGQTLPRALTQFKAFQVEISRQPFIHGDNFILVDYSTTNGFKTSTWITAIPANRLISPNTNSMILTSRCQDAQFSLFVGKNEWPIKANDQAQISFIARNTTLFSIGQEPIRIIVQQPQNHEPADLRAISPCFAEITAIQTDQPIRITGITLEKSFGRMGITLPLAEWEPGEITRRFIPMDPGGGAKLEDGVLLLDSGDYLQPGIRYQGDLFDLKQELAPTITQYLLVSYLLAAALSALYFLFFGWGMRLLSDLNNHAKVIIQKNANVFTNSLKSLQVNKPVDVSSLSSMVWLFVFILFLGFAITTQMTRYQGYIALIAFVVLVLGWVYIDHRYANSRLLLQVKKTATYLFQHETILLMILLGVGAFLLFFRLDAHDFFEDEFQVIAAAAGYMNTGTYFSWDWINRTITSVAYERAWPHTFLVAQSFRLFGISEWSARFVSALSGLLFLLVFYFFTRYFTNKRVALISLFSAVFYVSYLNFFRYTRMYALLIPLFILLAYCLFRGLTGEWWIKTKFRFIDRILSENFNFDYRFLLISIPLLYLNYHIHYNSLVIILAGFLFICLMAVLTKEKKYIILAMLGLMSIAGLYFANLLSLLNRFPWVIGLITFFRLRNVLYYYYLFQHPFGATAGLILILLLVIKNLKLKKDSEALHKTLYLVIIATTSAIFFIFIANRYTSMVYISHIMPIALILIMGGFWYLIQQFPKKCALLAFFLFVLVISSFIPNSKAFYSWTSNFGEFSTAYQVIRNNYSYDEEVIFGQYLRTYYLQPLDKIKHISMLNLRQYTFNQFISDLDKFDSGWLTWETRKAYHIEPQILNYIDTHFQKLHGDGLDDTMVEVYYYSKSNLDSNVLGDNPNTRAMTECSPMFKGSHKP